MRQMMKEKKAQLAGWGFFLVSACFFLVSSFRSGDLFYVSGSIFFLLGCLVFMSFLLFGEDRAGKR